MASRGVNKCILVGNLGADPEVRHSPGGTQVANLRVATTDSWKDKNTGEREQRTEWHRCVMFGRLAEIAGQYLRKGSQVYLEGALRTRKWTDRDGVERYSTEIVVNDMQMLGSPGPIAPVRDSGAHSQKKVSGSDVRMEGTFEPESGDIPF